MNSPDLFAKDKNKRAFTLIELLIVIALILILGTMATPFLSRFIVQTNYETSVDKVIGTIRKAQTYAMNNKDGVIWGVCFTSSLVRLYRGTCASPTQSEDFDIPTTVTISGLSDTTFSLNRGEASQALTITISSSVGSTQVLVNRAGGMTLN
jgi:prepilin-type N-terminal cleavage/methylation domain-containing protein